MQHFLVILLHQYSNMEHLLRLSQDLVQRTPDHPRRFLADKIDWSWRLVGIRGARGTGKTTLLIQHMKSLEKAVYFALDDLYFTQHTLRETVEALRLRGWRYFFLDEVHKYPHWSREIKNLHDYYNDINIVFTGSSIIELGKQEVDLSRRALMYDLPGLSFREYLAFSNIMTSSAYSLTELLEKHEAIGADLRRGFRPLEHFGTYLREGYYPYFLEGRGHYLQKVRQVARLVIETDLAQAEGAKIQQVQKLTRLLRFIAESTPFKPNIQHLAQHLELDRATVLRYLSHLRNAKLIGALDTPGGGLAALQRPEKVFLDNTNLSYALIEVTPNIGNLRETFFFNQTNAVSTVTAPEHGDFLVGNRFIFEVGGKGKTQRQRQGRPDSFLALDDIEVGMGNQVPLWLFGFLY